MKSVLYILFILFSYNQAYSQIASTKTVQEHDPTDFSVYQAEPKVDLSKLNIPIVKLKKHSKIGVEKKYRDVFIEQNLPKLSGDMEELDRYMFINKFINYKQIDFIRSYPSISAEKYKALKARFQLDN